jgi:hypothetical protein
VLAWAELAVKSMQGFEPVELSRGRFSDRVTQFAASRVFYLRDSEEAYQQGLPLEMLEYLPSGPRRKLGGYRRVLITALTWVPDHEEEIGYDPQWITLGWGMTAHEAVAAAKRFIRIYTEALANRVVSRELIVTAFEIKFWTASARADYL